MTLDRARADDLWTIIIPVKDTRLAKTRLSTLSRPQRARLARAFTMDSAMAALACESVREVLAVTNDRSAARALAGAGVRVLRDTPEAGLNAALEHGAWSVRRGDPWASVAAMSGDLPALRPSDLLSVFDAGSAYRRWFVADTERSGTTMLAARKGAPLRASFGPDSRGAHVASGAEAIEEPNLERLRRDVDTEQHLRQAMRLGVGGYTLDALADLGLVLGSSEIA